MADYLYRNFIMGVTAAGFRAVAHDEMGFGRSDKPEQESAYTIQRHAKQFGELMDELGLDGVTLVLQDWGGPIGLAWAVDHPERVRRLVLLNTFTGWIPPEIGKVPVLFKLLRAMPTTTSRRSRPRSTARRPRSSWTGGTEQVFTRTRPDIDQELAQIEAAGLLKRERTISSPQGAHVRLGADESVLNLCANNYLGLASHPAVIDAAREALERWGLGMASVRFICGTQAIHTELEAALSAFLGTDDTILYSSCFDANAGLFEVLLRPEDAVISDALNHASIIDGIRLCKAQRLRFRNSDMEELETRLREAGGARRRLIATDGVFSMDGYLARLQEICDLAERYDALVMVDDSHAIGVVGPDGRGTPALHEVVERVDVITGTLGKALGGASGGYTSGRRQIVQLLRQRSRPYLFSNSVAPPMVAAGLAALELIQRDETPRARLHANTEFFRARMGELGFEVLPGEHPIVPVMFGDEHVAGAMAERLLADGVYAIAFSYPVVPRGSARIRTQMSSIHERADLEHAATAFARARVAEAAGSRG